MKNNELLALSWSLSERITVKVFAICLAVLVSFASGAAAEKFESYLERPDVLTVEAQPGSFGSDWEKLRSAHFAFVAELLEVYQHQQIYFLARDSEHLYDVARLVTEGTPDANRIHLVNVSRANMRDKRLKEYLEQNGVTEKDLESGAKKVLFVDTGFAGTIPQVIGEAYSKKARHGMKTQLVVSDNPQHPSSRLFLGFLNPAVNEQLPSSMHGTIVGYEHMARYTDRATKFEMINGTLHPMSPAVSQGTDGAVSKSAAIAHMKDLKAEWQKPKVKSDFQKLRTKVRSLIVALESGDASKLSEELADRKNQRLESIVRDLIESASNSGRTSKVTVADLGLREDPIPKHAKKAWFMKQYPEWKVYLENPDKGIPSLFDKGDWHTLGAFIDADIDWEINRLIEKELFDSEASGQKRTLQASWIKAKAKEVKTSAVSPLSNLQDRIKDSAVQGRPEWFLIDLLLENADQMTRNIVLERLSKMGAPFTSEYVKRLRNALEKLPGNADLSYVPLVIKPEYAAEMLDYIKLVIDRSKTGEGHGLYWLSHKFSGPGMENHPELLRAYLEKAAPNEVAMVVQSVFSEPAWAKHTDLMKLAIKRGGEQMQTNFAYSVFSNERMMKHQDVLRMLIERIPSDSYEARTFKSQVFSQSFAQTPEMKRLAEALEIADLTKRKKFLSEQSQPMPKTFNGSRCEGLFLPRAS